MDEQLARSRELYRRRCERLLAALERHMPDGVGWTRPQGGFFSWLTLPDGVDAVELARRAVERGVAVVPGAPFFPDGRGADERAPLVQPRREDVIETGVERLAALL